MAGVISRKTGVKAALIHNPRGGWNRRRPSRVPVLAREAGIPVWEITTPDELALVLPDIARATPDLLIINGGDGTVDTVVTALRQTSLFAQEPMLALLAGGTTNMIARDVGPAGSPEHAMQRLINALTSGESGERVERPPLIVRSPAGRADRLGFFLGGGALPRLLKKIQDRVKDRGFVGQGTAICALARTALRLLFGDVRQDPVMAPRTLQWAVDEDRTESEPAVLYFITTLDRLVFEINPRRPTPGLRLLVLRHPYRRIMTSITRLLRRKPFDALGDDFIFREGRLMRLCFDDELVLDGEPVPLSGAPREIEIEVGAPFVFWRI